MKVDELLEKYSAIELAMIKIDEDKDSLSKLSQSTKKAFDKQISDLKKLVTTKENDLDSLQKHIDEISSSFEKKISELNEQIESIQEETDEIYESLPEINVQIEEIQNENKSIVRRIAAIEKQLKGLPIGGAQINPGGHSHPKVTIDYKEEATAAELYAKYYGKIDTPVVIRLANWRNDYCMVVRSVENGYVSGDTYSQGVYVKSERRRDANTMKMYRTKYMAEIMADQAERY